MTLNGVPVGIPLDPGCPYCKQKDMQIERLIRAETKNAVIIAKLREEVAKL